MKQAVALCGVAAIALCGLAAIVLFGSPRSRGADDHAPGMTLRHLWTVRDAMLAGSVSADGRSLCLVDWTAGNVAIRTLPDASTRLLTANESWDDIAGWPEEAALSRDARRVAHTWYDRAKDHFELRVTKRDAPRAAPIVHRESAEKFWVRPLDWSPDGKRLAAVFRTDDRARLVIVSVGPETVNSVRVLKTWRGRALPLVARFSPDGTRLAHDLGSEERRDVFVVTLTTAAERPLVTQAAVDRFVDWTPDGANILFISDRSGERGLWMQSVAPRRPRAAPRLLKRALHGRPHGLDRYGTLYYSASAGRRDVMIASLDEEGTRFLSPTIEASARFVHHTSAAEWSPDGRFLAYRCEGPGARGSNASCVAIRNVATGEERSLPLMPPFRSDSSVHWLRWGPDGETLRVLATHASGKRALYAVDVATGGARLLPHGAERAAALSPDGAFLFYWRAGRTIVRRDLASGKETVLHRQTARGGGLDVSPDGRSLVFRRSADSIVVLPTDGGSVREVYRFPDRESNEQDTGVRWTPDGKRVLLVRRGRELWSVDVRTQAAHRIGPDIPGLRGVSMHPDGRRLAFTTGRSGTALWAMEGFLPR